MAFVERGRSTEHLMGIGDRNEGSGGMAVRALDDIVAGRGVVRMINLDRQDLVTLDQRLADRCDLEHAL